MKFNAGFYLRLATPLTIGLIVGSICRIKPDSGASIPARPPGYLFGIIWFIIYILLGVSWAMTGQKSRSNSRRYHLCY